MLLGNYTVLNKSPGRFFSGGTVSDSRANWNNPGETRGFVNETTRNLSSIPNGCTPPVSWIIPQVSGGIASRTGAAGVGVVGSLNLAGGLNGAAGLTGSGDVSQAAVLYIIVAAAAITASGDAAADIFGTLVAEAGVTATGDIGADLSAAIAALADLSGTGDLNGDIAGALTALADITASGGLTADVIGKLEILADLIGSGSASADLESVWSMVCNLLADGSLASSITALGNSLSDVLGSAAMTANPQAKAAIAAAVNVTGDLLTTSNVGGSVWSSPSRTLSVDGVDEIKDGLATEASQGIMNDGIKKASLLIPHTQDI